MKEKLVLALTLTAATMTMSQTQSFATNSGEVKITPLVHASTMIEAAGRTIYVDPAKPIKLDGLPKADLIVITHLHGDHFDPAAIAALRKPETVIITPANVASLLAGATTMANGETKLWQGWTIEAVPAYNLVRGPVPGQLFHPKGRDNGYVLGYGGKRFYFSSDTEGVPEMRALKNIDVAFICFNLPYTMTPEEAADAVRAFHPKVVIPYHYRGSDRELFRTKLAGSGVEVRMLEWYPK